MRNTLRKGLEVFDFKDEDELVESNAGRFAGKFGNPNSDHPPLLKYNFLERFARSSDVQETDVSDVPCIDVDASYGDHACKDNGLCALDTSEGKCASGFDETLVSHCINSRAHAISNSYDNLPRNMLPGSTRVSSHATDALSLGEPFSRNQQQNCSLSELSLNNKPVDVNSDVNSDDDGKSEKASPRSNYSYDMRENEGSSEDSASYHSPRGRTMENINITVIAPDYLIFGDKYCTESSLTFSSSGIKLEGRNACGSKEFLCYEWGISEIEEIKSQWFARVQTALVKVCVRPAAVVGVECLDRTLGYEELKFAVYDSSWSETRDRIISIDARYEAIWRILLDTDMKEENEFIGNETCNSKSYFSNFDEPFEDVIYPKGDPDAVSISKRDVELLQPETFINDTIIDFYIKYLKNKMKFEDRQKFHFFNSFFFRKLADMDKDPSSASEGRAAFLRVRKWTRKVNLFEKDFLFIPVNFNLHWSLIVVCHPGEIACCRDEDIGKSPKVPCILHMDSIKGSHKGLKNLVQSYLWEEWRERQADSFEDVSSKFFNLRFVPLELPQQENSFDCGLFLLHYVELFLEDAPVYFNPFKITEFSTFLSMDWFPPAEASLKRAHIQKLIYELLEDHSQNINSVASDGGHCSSQLMANDNAEENGLEILERESPAKECNGLVFRELLEPGTSAGSSQNGQLQSFDHLNSFHRFKAVMSPMVEDEGEQFAYSPSGGEDCSEVAETTADACTTSYSSQRFRMLEPIFSAEKTVREDENEDEVSSSETSSLMSQSSSDVRMDEHPTGNHFLGANLEEETEQPNIELHEIDGCTTGSPDSASIKQLETCVVEDSQEDDRMGKKNEIKDPSSTCQENPPIISNQPVILGETTHLQPNCHNFASESPEERVAKRLKVASLEGDMAGEKPDHVVLHLA